jgi:hypothetical protein
LWYFDDSLLLQLFRESFSEEKIIARIAVCFFAIAITVIHNRQRDEFMDEIKPILRIGYDVVEVCLTYICHLLCLVAVIINGSSTRLQNSAIKYATLLVYYIESRKLLHYLERYGIYTYVTVLC